MRNTEKIEKQLFKDEPIFLKELEGNKGQKEIKKWKWTMNEYKNPDEVETEMEKVKKNKADDSANMDKDYRCRTCHYFTADYYIQPGGKLLFQVLPSEKEG